MRLIVMLKATLGWPLTYAGSTIIQGYCSGLLVNAIDQHCWPTLVTNCPTLVTYSAARHAELPFFTYLLYLPSLLTLLFPRAVGERPLYSNKLCNHAMPTRYANPLLKKTSAQALQAAPAQDSTLHTQRRHTLAQGRVTRAQGIFLCHAAAVLQQRHQKA